MVMPVATTIYVYLLDEGTDCWRPVSAEHFRDDVYRIKGEPPDPEDEMGVFAGSSCALSPAETLGRRLSCRVRGRQCMRSYGTKVS